jgi:hypothetical protein
LDLLGSIVTRKSGAATISEVVELGYLFDPIQGVVLVGLAETRNLGSDPSPNRLQPGIRHEETQFAQAPGPSPLTHHPHSFRRCRHVAPRSRRVARAHES